MNFSKNTAMVNKSGAIGGNPPGGMNDYKKAAARKLLLIAGLFLLLTAVFFVDVFTGSSGMSPSKVLEAVFYPDQVDSMSRVIVWTYRLPIAIMALLVGAALGIAGSQMQTILNNPLASPFTLGISAAAGFGASLAIVFGYRYFPQIENYAVPLAAFVFAFLSMLLICGIGRAKRGVAETIILVGVALAFLFNALLSMVQFFSTADELQAIVFWLFGSLMQSNWEKIGILALALAIVAPLIATNAWKLTAMRLGDEKAKSLGVNAEGLRLSTLAYVSIITALAVCFTGVIGFIGLVAPHIARMAVGEDQRFFMPLAGLCGALVLSSASILCKAIVPGIIFPIGIITSLVGIPFFLTMIIGKKQQYW
jgi:iron complex transport system permease protein